MFAPYHIPLAYKSPPHRPLALPPPHLPRNQTTPNPRSQASKKQLLPPMANRCASLDPTWAHLPAPAPSPWPRAAWLSPAAAFENDALTSALRASMCGASSPTPSSSTTSSASEILATPHDAPAAPGPSPAPGATGRVSKRKIRASRRAQTTYISADPANFLRMVQEITGFPVPGAEPALAASSPAPRPAALACVLPTLDTSAFLLDRAPAPPRQEEDKTSSGAAATMAAAAEAAAEESSLLLELEAMVSAPAAFPSLESWGMM